MRTAIARVASLLRAQEDNQGIFASIPDIRLSLVAAVATAMLLAGCGSRSVPADQSGSGATSSSWTTLGTRALTSHPGTAITSNAGAKWVDYNPPVLYPKTISQNVQYIAMPDGVQLAVYVTLPADSNGVAAAGTFPTVFIQTAYNNGAEPYTDAYITQHGYAQVVVDVRGTGESQGSWEAFGPTEQSDYANMVNWVTQQKWSNGVLGVFGYSYVGITAIMTAAQNHPAVKSAFVINAIGDGYRDVVFTGGQVNPTFIPLWLGLVSVLGVIDPAVLTDPVVALPAVVDHILAAATDFQVPTVLKGVAGDPSTAYDNPAPDSFWSIRSPLERDDKITVPTFIVGGLHDIFQRGEPLHYEELKTHVPAKLLIGPWQHTTTGPDLPLDGVPVFDHIELQWFDQYLKGMKTGAAEIPNVTQYVSGYGHFVTATDWPNPQARAQKLYLRGDQSLSASAPAAGEASNTVVQEPINGLCSISTSQWTAGALGALPLSCFTDDSVTELTDVKYQTAPLTQDMYINGPIEADVWMSTTANDAGLSVRVDDVDASGNVTALTNGIQTASMRAVDTTRSRFINGLMIQPWHPFTLASVQPLTSGTPVLVPVEIFPTSAMIAKGHSLRVAIGASDLPQGVPPVPTLLNSAIGALTLYSNAAHPSSVVIPVVPTSTLN